MDKRSDVARRCGASVEQDTTSDAEANAPFRDRWRVERPERWSELPWSPGSWPLARGRATTPFLIA
jgi:hypothetical protein